MDFHQMNGNSRTTLLSAVLVATTVLLCLLASDRQTSVAAYPALESNSLLWANDNCNNNADLRLNCERCAKYTRSHEIYKKCCHNSVDGERKDTVRFWCERFLLHEIDEQLN